MYFRFVDNLIFHIMGQMQMCTQPWSLRRSELFTVTRQVAPLNSALGAKSAVAEDFFLFVVPCVKLVISQLFSDARQTFRRAYRIVCCHHFASPWPIGPFACHPVYFSNERLVHYYFCRVYAGLLRTSMGACIT